MERYNPVICLDSSDDEVIEIQENEVVDVSDDEAIDLRSMVS